MNSSVSKSPERGAPSSRARSREFSISRSVSISIGATVTSTSAPGLRSVSALT